MDRKRILIADEDQKLIVQLKDMLVPMGYKVSTAIDGATALQKALNLRPDLIIMEMDMSIISGAKIAQILRTNPRTAETCIYFLDSERVEIESFDEERDVFIQKPINYGNLVLMIDSFFKGQGKKEEASILGEELSGHLSQISLIDLLQVFSMNKKSGQLVINYNNGNAIVFIKDGNIINVQVDDIEGDKAFYRLLTLKEEHFNFIPEGFVVGSDDIPPKIFRKTDSLLMEGLRQLDEWKKMESNLPALSTTVKLNVDPSTLAKGIKPITKEIFSLMDYYNSVKDIVDHCSFSDFEALKSIFVLLQKGVIQVVSTDTAAEEGKSFLLTSDQLVSIKKRILETRGFKSNKKFGKILVIGDEYRTLKRFVKTFSRLKEFKINRQNLGSSHEKVLISIIGTLKLTDGLNLLFYSMPVADSFKPVWNIFSKDIIDVLLLLPQKEADDTQSLSSASGFFYKHFGKVVKPVLITDDPVTDGELSKVKREYDLNSVFTYNINEKQGVNDFFVDLFTKS